MNGWLPYFSVLTACLFLAFPGFLFGQGKQLDSLDFTTAQDGYVLIKGAVKEVHKSRLDSVRVDVYLGNEPVYSNVSASNKFEVVLPLGGKFFVEINRSGYYAKLISVDTRQEEDIQPKPHHLVFDFYLIEERKLKGIDDFIMDFPTGLIFYNGRKDKFDFDKKYTKRMFRDVNRLLDKAEERQKAPKVRD